MPEMTATVVAVVLAPRRHIDTLLVSTHIEEKSQMVKAYIPAIGAAAVAVVFAPRRHDTLTLG